jgi:competence protein ComEC
MVTGDTSALDAELDLAMKTVGMTHLTAVSGDKAIK